MRKVVVVAGVVIAAQLLAGCQGMWADQCADMGYNRGTGLFLDCMNSKHAMFNSAMDGLIAAGAAMSAQGQAQADYLNAQVRANANANANSHPYGYSCNMSRSGPGQYSGTCY